LGDKYLLGELLGQGGFGAVYTARHMLLNREQAIKILLDQHFTNLEFRDRFIREARILAALAHPNIVHVDDFGFDGNRAYLVMPYIGGGTLQDVLKQRGTFALDEVQRYVEGICAALEYAHARNVAHLDLKPSNLLISTAQHLLLSDFGLAHLLEQGLVKGGASLEFGTPQYMAPEQWQGQPELRSDLYSLGVLLYRMLAGRLPFEEENILALRYKHETETPPLLRTIRPELPVELEEIAAKLLAKRPEDRYQTVGQFLFAFTLARLRYARQTLSKRYSKLTTPLPPTPDDLLELAAAPPLHDLNPLEEIIQTARTSLQDTLPPAEDASKEGTSSAPEAGEASTAVEPMLLSDLFNGHSEDASGPSVWPAKEPASSSGNFLLLLQFLTFGSGIVGLAAFFFLPWLQTPTPGLIVAPSGFSLSQSGNLAWLLWAEPIGAAQLIVLAYLQSTKRANHAAGGRWKWLLVTTTPLFTFALFLGYVSLLGAGVIFDGLLDRLIIFDSGFWLGVVSLMLGSISGCVGVVYSSHQSPL